MARVVVLVLLIFVVVTVLAWYVRSRPVPARTVAPRAETPAIDSAAYRNHLGMARWIEGRLGDDLVRSALEPDDHDRARQLLQDFYGEDS